MAINFRRIAGGIIRWVTGSVMVFDVTADGIELGSSKKIVFGDATEQTTAYTGSDVKSTPVSGGYQITNIYIGADGQMKVDHSSTPAS